LSVALSGVCLIQGCSGGSSNETEFIAKPPAAAEAEKKAMEGMKKAMMKQLATKGKRKG
jgi:hypothetical protein